LNLLTRSSCRTSLTPNLSRTRLGEATNRPSRFSGQPAVAWYTALAMAADMPATSRPLFIASLREFRSEIAPSWPVGLVEVAAWAVRPPPAGRRTASLPRVTSTFRVLSSCRNRPLVRPALPGRRGVAADRGIACRFRWVVTPDNVRVSCGNGCRHWRADTWPTARPVRDQSFIDRTGRGAPRDSPSPIEPAWVDCISAALAA
jgi:hypothetical protein